MKRDKRKLGLKAETIVQLKEVTITALRDVMGGRRPVIHSGGGDSACTGFDC